VVTVLTATLADDLLSVDQTGTLTATIVTVALTADAVWRVPNQPS
jgi:hypothetical protein